MSGYIGTQPVPQATQTRDVFTATSGQTSFATSGYTPNFLDVWLNGVKLVNGDDFTATNGSDVVLTSGAAAGDTVEVLSYSTYEVNAQTYTGGLTVNNDAATVLTVDRATSDGSIIDVKKSGTTVGSIGSDGSLVRLSSASTGGVFVADNGTNVFGFVNGENALRPASDNAINLGKTDRRFKNLYLSGGVYLGGTGAANLLDDYEEGTFTPTLSSSNNDFVPVYVPTYTYGRYTKIGNMVFFDLEVRTSSVSGAKTGDLVIGGLPFNNTSTASVPSFSLSVYNVSFNVNYLYDVEFYSYNSLYIRESRSGTTSSILPASSWLSANPSLLRTTGSYCTDA